MRTRKEVLGFDSGRMCFGKHLDKDKDLELGILRPTCVCSQVKSSISPIPSELVSFTNLRLEIINPGKHPILMDGINGYKCTKCNTRIFCPVSKDRILEAFVYNSLILGRTMTKAAEIIGKIIVNDYDEPFSYDPFTIFVFNRSLSLPKVT